MEHTLHPAIASALKKSCDRILEEFDQRDVDFIATEARSRPTTPLVSGLGNLIKTSGLDKPIERVDKYVQRLPHWVIDGLGYVAFKPETRYEYTRTTSGNEKARASLVLVPPDELPARLEELRQINLQDIRVA